MFKPTSIGTKLKFVGGLLSFIIISVIILTVYMNNKSQKDSLIINIAGKQRMLTQKMSKEIFYIKHKDANDFRELNTAADLFAENLNDLLYGNAVKGIYAPQDIGIKKKLEEVLGIWEPFRNNIENLKQLLIDVQPDVEVLVQRTTHLLTLSDKIVKSMVKANFSGEYIDFSGRQRMLSQRMSLFVERYLRTDNEEDYLNFLNARKMYTQMLEHFLNAPEVQNIDPVYLQVKECYAYWQEHDKYLMQLVKDENQINQIISYIYEKNIKLLNTMDAAVWLYTDYSESKNSIFVKFQYIALIIVLLIILYTFLLTKEIVNHVNSFVKQAKALKSVDISNLDTTEIFDIDDSEDELKEASSHISSFVSKVNSAMSHSKDAISKAESAVKELQYLADDVGNALEDLDVDERDKNSFDKSVNATEDIAIESTENLLHVKKMLEKLQLNLTALVEKSESTK